MLDFLYLEGNFQPLDFAVVAIIGIGPVFPFFGAGFLQHEVFGIYETDVDIAVESVGNFDGIAFFALDLSHSVI